jgi:hypothetical protein
MLTVAVLNSGIWPEVDPLGYVTEMTPAFVVTLLPHPDTTAANPPSRNRDTTFITKSLELNNGR